MAKNTVKAAKRKLRAAKMTAKADAPPKKVMKKPAAAMKTMKTATSKAMKAMKQVNASSVADLGSGDMIDREKFWQDSVARLRLLEGLKAIGGALD